MRCAHHRHHRSLNINMLMSDKKRLMYCALVALLLLAGLAIYNRCSKANVVRVERDTIVVYDTIPDYHPVPKDSIVTKYVTRYLPVVSHDTIDHFLEVTKMVHDSVLVEVPITSKHYGNDTYDAWVSGFEPSLDSIKVYRETQYITERVTISKPPNKWELDAAAGIDYNVKSQRYTPYAGGELMYKPSRLQIGIRGGVTKTDKFDPFAGAVIKYRLF
jgi:hypothetical protein